MTPKIVAFLVTLLVNIVAGVAVFFFMILAMNGFSESDANYGIGAYIVLALRVTFLMSAGAALTTHLMVKRGLSSVAAAMIAILVFSALGAGLKIVCSVIGVLVADYVRVNY